ncbi:MAG: hypothetical protein ISR72_04600, partial [Methylobacter sp.]|nr:hypothetical protein [Methylobacter sp.]
MNKQMLNLIERAIRSDVQAFPFNRSWQYLHQHYNIGQTQGNKLNLIKKDKDELLAIVKGELGIDLELTTLADFADMNREQALGFALDEKIAGQAVKKHRVAIKTLPGTALKINGLSCSLPGCGHFDLALSDLSATGHNVILLVENYRCFDRLEKMRLNLPDQYADPLVLYRGDNDYSEKTVRQLLAQLDLPVLAMVDIDPKGLSIAQSFPNVIGLIAPCLAELEVSLRDRGKANPKLYQQQLAGCRNALSNSPFTLIRQLWDML